MTGSVVLVVAALALSACGGSGAKGPGAPRVEFIVTGSAPNGVNVTYGDDTSNYQTKNLPLDVTRLTKENVVYWVMAQLQGGGRITCRVVIRKPAQGHGVGETARAGHAVGGYNACTAQSPGDPVGGWN